MKIFLPKDREGVTDGFIEQTNVYIFDLTKSNTNKKMVIVKKAFYA